MPIELIRGSNVPAGVNIFMWKTAVNALVTKVELKVIFSETRDHNAIQCPFARLAWGKVLVVFKIDTRELLNNLNL